MLPDDFGAGGVSLFHLKRYPVQTLKIECSLVRGIGAETSNSPIVSAIISLAHSLKMRVIAKGIEAQELAFLQSLGCDSYQGNLYSAPLPQKLFAEFVKKQAKPAPVKPSEQTAQPSAFELEPVRIEVKAKVVHQEVAEDTQLVEEKPPTAAAYLVSCFNCNSRYDALVAPWCFCLTSDQTLVCPSCGKCFCMAPLEYRHQVWDSAPENFWNRKRQHEAEQGGLPVNPPPEQSRRPLVLVVDDEYQVLKAAWRLIHGLGYSVILAQDGEEGLRMAREYAPQLILSDALMPKLDERELCRLLKLDPNTASVKTVIMTAFTGAGKYKTTHLKEYHFDDYLQKPIEFEKLRAVLQKHLK